MGPICMFQIDKSAHTYYNAFFIVHNNTAESTKNALKVNYAVIITIIAFAFIQEKCM